MFCMYHDIVSTLQNWMAVPNFAILVRSLANLWSARHFKCYQIPEKFSGKLWLVQLYINMDLICMSSIEKRFIKHNGIDTGLMLHWEQIYRKFQLNSVINQLPPKTFNNAGTHNGRNRLTRNPIRPLCEFNTKSDYFSQQVLLTCHITWWSLLCPIIVYVRRQVLFEKSLWRVNLRQSI